MYFDLLKNGGIVPASGTKNLRKALKFKISGLFHFAKEFKNARFGSRRKGFWENSINQNGKFPGLKGKKKTFQTGRQEGLNFQGKQKLYTF